VNAPGLAGSAKGVSPKLAAQRSLGKALPATKRGASRDGQALAQRGRRPLKFTYDNTGAA